MPYKLSLPATLRHRLSRNINIIFTKPAEKQNKRAKRQKGVGLQTQHTTDHQSLKLGTVMIPSIEVVEAPVDLESKPNPIRRSGAGADLASTDKKNAIVRNASVHSTSSYGSGLSWISNPLPPSAKSSFVQSADRKESLQVPAHLIEAFSSPPISPNTLDFEADLFRNHLNANMSFFKGLTNQPQARQASEVAEVQMNRQNDLFEQEAKSFVVRKARPVLIKRKVMHAHMQALPTIAEGTTRSEEASSACYGGVMALKRHSGLRQMTRSGNAARERRHLRMAQSVF